MLRQEGRKDPGTRNWRPGRTPDPGKKEGPRTPERRPGRMLPFSLLTCLQQQVQLAREGRERGWEVGGKGVPVKDGRTEAGGRGGGEVDEGGRGSHSLRYIWEPTVSPFFTWRNLPYPAEYAYAKQHQGRISSWQCGSRCRLHCGCRKCFMGFRKSHRVTQNVIEFPKTNSRRPPKIL